MGKKGGEKMARFLGVHKLTQEFTDQEIEEGYSKYKASAMAKGLRPLSAVYNQEKGFAYCQTEAESADQVRKAHEEAGISIEDVIEVKPIQ